MNICIQYSFTTKKKKKKINKWHIGLESLSLQCPSLQKTLRLANSFSGGIRGWRGWGSPSHGRFPLSARMIDCGSTRLWGRLINTRQMRYPTSESTNHCCSLLFASWRRFPHSLWWSFSITKPHYVTARVRVKCVCLVVHVVKLISFPPIQWMERQTEGMGAWLGG